MAALLADIKNNTGLFAQNNSLSLLQFVTGEDYTSTGYAKYNSDRSK